MTDTSRRNEKIAQAVKTILATAEDHFDGGWASHPADDMTKVVSEVVESAVAEAFKAGQKSLLKNLRRLTPQDYGRRCSYIIVDEMGEFDWAKIEELTTPPKQTQHDDTK